jgi:hypothetical protein
MRQAVELPMLDQKACANNNMKRITIGQSYQLTFTGMFLCYQANHHI